MGKALFAVSFKLTAPVKVADGRGCDAVISRQWLSPGKAHNANLSL